MLPEDFVNTPAPGYVFLHITRRADDKYKNAPPLLMPSLFSRRQWFCNLCLSGLSAAGYARYWEPHWFDLSTTRVQIPGNLGVRPWRILHLSDFHVSDGLPAEAVHAAVQLGLAKKPDLICLTGDYVSATVGFDETGLRRILQAAAQTAPSYAVTGNHDGGRWLARHGGDSGSERMRRILEQSGVEVLHNRAATVQLRGRPVQLAGIADLWSGELDEARAFSAVDPALPTLLLSHNPDGKSICAHARWDLMLSGHTHGGQVVAPLIPPVWIPTTDKSMVAGLYAWKGRQIYITRGVGSPKSLRFACRPEVSWLEVTGTDSSSSRTT